ncbi:hypothetical protein KVF89_09950 [Nocardioides carbamazepini]|uniref:hypothetical protein n=1 Tax=Nocardioides carbamazepini TaxID=2854259 RepID=UPI00214A0475|nr:hypothetical protein [Nocardioides carbamazepini]MCR1782855.1 hypothetical protein [Nocardioides carbamazepini]
MTLISAPVWRLLVLALAVSTLGVPAAMAAAPQPQTAAPTAELPDPLDRGSYTPATVQEAKLGLVDLQEPASDGSAPAAGTARAAEQLEVRGALYYPQDRTEPSPVIILVHGNHGSCDAGQDPVTASCAQFKRNEAGYAYLGENLATWGYTTFSVSQDQMMMRQDGPKGKGMHQRRKLIAAALDALSAANEAGGLPVDEHTTIGTTLAGRLDMTRIGLMGHSRGGDAVTSFIDYNRIRTDGPRYPLRGVISLAPVDYERKAPYGTPYLSILPWCDGDVSNLQGARFFERSQYINADDPFPRIQSSQLGANHNWYNTVWFADGQDGGNVTDAACGDSRPTNSNNVQPNNLRLSGAASYDNPWSYVLDNSDTYNPLVNTKISGDPARMGDQEKIGLATMGAFFRRYVGGEGAFEPYLTGELSDTPTHEQIPASACPTSVSGTRIACAERVSTSYFPAAGERIDVIRPEVTNPLSLNAVGGALTGSGFVNPYLADGGVSPLPKATAGGYDWCNPEPDDFAPAQLGKGSQPTGAKACPLPGKAALGGQNGTRENAPVNHSYGRQLALAWESGSDAVLTADIPAASADVSGLKALALGADVNFFDTRNPGADSEERTYDPASTTQDFQIVLVDAAGHEAVVNAGDPRWGNALHMSTGTQTSRTHIVLDQIRVPLTEFAAQGVDLSAIDTLELRFGGAGLPQSGSIQLADVRFQEAAVDAPLVLSDGTDVDQGAGYGPPATGPDPAEFLAETDNAPGNLSLVDTVGEAAANTAWVVDDDRAQCPDANYTSIQTAVDFASPWDTIVVCEGVYEESSTPVSGPGNPVATGALNGLTITKPLRIKGAGADKVTIKPDPSIGDLAGLTPYLRDGGGNVITVSRQSLGSTDTNEMFVDISGVTVTSGDTWAEAGIAFFGAAGRVSESKVGPLRTASDAGELAEHPHGWGVVKTGVIQGAGPGTVESEVTVADSQVTGYQSGGILFDGAKGVDGGPANTVRTGIIQNGYVLDTAVTGTPGSTFPQIGVKFTSGMQGKISGSRITGNYYRPDPTRSYGILLADAGTEGSLSGESSIVTGNGWAVYNGTADLSGVRGDAPFALRTSYVGTGDPVAGGPSDPANGLEAISGSGSVTLLQRQSTMPSGVPTGPGAPTDAAPTAALVDPGSGVSLKVGETLLPVALGRDDHAVRSASLLVDGDVVETVSHAPYVFRWTPGGKDAGRSVALSTTVTDSAGQATTSPAVTVAVTKEVIAPAATVIGMAKNKKKGTAQVAVALNTAGTVVLAGPGVAAKSATTAGADTATLVVKPKGKLKKKLQKKGRAKVAVTLTFTSAGGTVTVTEVVKLVRKRK